MLEAPCCIGVGSAAQLQQSKRMQRRAGCATNSCCVWQNQHSLARWTSFARHGSCRLGGLLSAACFWLLVQIQLTQYCGSRQPMLRVFIAHIIHRPARSFPHCQCGTMRFTSTTKVLAKRMVKVLQNVYVCECCRAWVASLIHSGTMMAWQPCSLWSCTLICSVSSRMLTGSTQATLLTHPPGAKFVLIYILLYKSYHDYCRYYYDSITTVVIGPANAVTFEKD